jgi:ABC-2 type transport system ATP-binding protein
VLGLLRPARGTVRVFGLDPMVHEAEVKAKVAYVADAVGFYPWMSVRDVLELQASVRPGWNGEVAEQLLKRFDLDADAPTPSLSKGQKTQLALTAAVASDPEVLVLDEPTSGLDPLVRGQFLEAVIGAFQDRQPERKTLLVSTHLIREFEGVIDEFSVLAHGRLVLTATADAARARFNRLRAWFDAEVPEALPVKPLRTKRLLGRSLELVIDGEAEAAGRALTAAGASRVEATALSLEDIFLVTGCEATP